MPTFSDRSTRILNEVHGDLQHLFRVVVRQFNCTILDDGGLRTPARQRELVAAGASRTTNSNHLTGRAVDVAPWPIAWDDVPWWEAFGHYVKAVAEREGIVIEWGGDWHSFKDYPHWQLPRA